MQKVFASPSELEKSVKEALHIPPFLMMENAAAALENAVRNAVKELFPKTSETFSKTSHSKKLTSKAESKAKILIVCGSGNNGGDGYALARRIFCDFDCTLAAVSEPKTEEAIIQRDMAVLAGVRVLKELPPQKDLDFFDITVDCILGTGFSGTLREGTLKIIEKLNSLSSYKISCDVPSGFAFKADCTLTMGTLKTELFSDRGKEFSGSIIPVDLGIPKNVFESYGKPDAFLIEKEDIKLPFRKNMASHKGNFGHSSVFAGEKSGAGIIAASAALSFGSGLSSIIPTENSNLSQFKISPELMISPSIPKNATAILIGSGLGKEKDFQNAVNEFSSWFCAAKNPYCVIDADMFYYKDFPSLLEKLNSLPSSRIILTPHPKELKALYQSLFPNEPELSIAEISDSRISIGKKICSRFLNVTLVMKSANTFIASAKKDCHSNKREVEIYICSEGFPSLAKGGSGDVLAGMCLSLLAQGYSAKDAAITAVYTHGAASRKFSGGSGFDLTPEKLINEIREF